MSNNYKNRRPILRDSIDQNEEYKIILVIGCLGIIMIILMGLICIV